MAYQQELANRIRDLITIFPEELRGYVSEKKMFGRIAFLYRGKMTGGAIKDDLMVRVIADKMEEIRALKQVRPMDFTKRPMKEFVFVSPGGYVNGEQLHFWISLGIEHAIHKSKIN